MLIKTEDFDKALAVVAPVAHGGGRALPVMSHVRLRVKNGSLSMLACDTHCEARAVTQCEGDDPLNVALPVARLEDFLAHAGDDLVIDKGEKATCSIKSGKRRAAIAFLPGNDVPTIKSDGKSIDMEIDAVGAMVDLVSCATMKMSIDIYKAGVAFQSNGKELIAVATSGFMLAVKRMPFQAPEFATMLHMDSVKLARAFPATSVHVFGSDQVGFANDSSRILCKAMSTQFPQWQPILDRSKVEQKIVVDRREFLDAIRLATPFSERVVALKYVSRKEYAIRLAAKDGALNIFAKGVKDQVENEVPAEGELHECNFDARQILSIVERLSEDKVTLGFSGTGERMLVNEDGATFILVSMKV